LTWIEDPSERELEPSPDLSLGSITTVETTDEDNSRAAKRERPFPFGFTRPADTPKRRKRARKEKP
jgi:hypothetical protein